jgi:hypothetical protein
VLLQPTVAVEPDVRAALEAEGRDVQVALVLALNQQQFEENTRTKIQRRTAPDDYVTGALLMSTVEVFEIVKAKEAARAAKIAEKKRKLEMAPLLAAAKAREKSELTTMKQNDQCATKTYAASLRKIELHQRKLAAAERKLLRVALAERKRMNSEDKQQWHVTASKIK